MAMLRARTVLRARAAATALRSATMKHCFASGTPAKIVDRPSHL